MQEWHLITNDNFELIITCKEVEITRNGFRRMQIYLL